VLRSECLAHRFVSGSEVRAIRLAETVESKAQKCGCRPSGVGLLLIGSGFSRPAQAGSIGNTTRSTRTVLRTSSPNLASRKTRENRTAPGDQAALPGSVFWRA
jgi:hypothetical protein